MIISKPTTPYKNQIGYVMILISGKFLPYINYNYWITVLELPLPHLLQGSDAFWKAGNSNSGPAMTQRHLWRCVTALYSVKLSLTCLSILYRFIYLQLKATYWMRWWKPCAPSSISVILLDVIYTTLRVLQLWTMPFTVFATTVRYFRQLVFVTISIYQGNTPLSTTLNLYRPLGPQMAFAPQLQNLNTLKLWRSHGDVLVVSMHSAKCCWLISSSISLLPVLLILLTTACSRALAYHLFWTNFIVRISIVCIYCNHVLNLR